MVSKRALRRVCRSVSISLDVNSEMWVLTGAPARKSSMQRQCPLRRHPRRGQSCPGDVAAAMSMATRELEHRRIHTWVIVLVTARTQPTQVMLSICSFKKSLLVQPCVHEDGACHRCKVKGGNAVFPRHGRGTATLSKTRRPPFHPGATGARKAGARAKMSHGGNVYGMVRG